MYNTIVQLSLALYYSLLLLLLPFYGYYYPHVQIGKHVDISVTICVFLFVWLWISPLRIKLAASKFAGQFIRIQGRESPILRNFVLSQKPKIGRIGQNEERWMIQLVTPHRSWNIARRVDIGSACVDRGQSPLTYLFKTTCVAGTPS